METADFARAFEYENGFYATASLARISKFVTHLDLFRRSQGLPGEIVECGVFKGNSLFRLVKFRDLLESPASRKVIAFDIFGKFPDDAGAEDRQTLDQFLQAAGCQGRDRQEIAALLDGAGCGANVELVAGDVRESISSYLERVPQLRVSLLHVDVDLYEPTKVALELLFPRLVPGGIAILDDYGAFPGANRAIEEYFAASGEVVRKLPHANAIAYVEKGWRPLAERGT
ncbi:TylF/MycF/NovP-related O-methyltransferase [Magnetospirillum sp. 64-120]|uniref:TylF/MycF/NovP-related O-methyltransferase n=1 Tax=Magnetospirillum sp. 64-120 TaxID=1895778 RepID=UPI00092CDBCD|nr:TylF/MycF/NovP-related O-methyltransferase [Magnetospirillum sp. 64-120]OJX70351.1 MAG: hypothetical protein BGO92_17320 [Magnetospirillum sp. 64-120]